MGPDHQREILLTILFKLFERNKIFIFLQFFKFYFYFYFYFLKLPSLLAFFSFVIIKFVLKKILFYQLLSLIAHSAIKSLSKIYQYI